MGKQSSRLIYQGKDYKEIICRGNGYNLNFHDKLYKGSQLVWEKIYPERCFVLGNNSYEENTSILFLKEGYAERKMISIDNRFENKFNGIACFGKELALCDCGGLSITKDFKKFKVISPYFAREHTFVGNSLFEYSYDEDSTIFIIDKNMEYEKKYINFYGYSLLCGYLLRGYGKGWLSLNVGNFVGFFKYLKKSSKDGFEIEYLLIDEHGNEKKYIDLFPTPTNNASYNTVNKKDIDTATIRIIIGKYFFYIKNARYLYNGNKEKSYYSRTIIMKRNLEDFSLEIAKDLGGYHSDGTSDGIFFPDILQDNSILDHVLYSSESKFIYLIEGQNLTGGEKNLYLLEVRSDGNCSLKKIEKKELKINVFGNPDRKITIKFDVEDKETGIDEINIHYHIFSHVGSPTVYNGKIESDVINGMAFYFNNAGKIMGEIYIDNQNFDYSESNYAIIE